MPRRTRPTNLTLSLFAENPVLSVSELTADIKTALEADFHDLYVQGEISNFKKYPSGHWYFTLKDANAQISAVFFRNWNRLLRFDPENGLEVKVRGRLSVWEKSGNYQFNVESMEPVGVGALQLAFEQALEHRRAFLAGVPTAGTFSVGQEGRYATLSRGPPIHNFWSYLEDNLRDACRAERRTLTGNVACVPPLVSWTDCWR